MNVLVVGVDAVGLMDATSIIVTNFLTYYAKNRSNINFTFFGYSKNEGTQKIAPNIEAVSIQSPYEKPKFSFYRILRKTFYLIGLDSGTLTWHYCYRNFKKVLGKNNFDYVIAAAGCFEYAEAAFRYASKIHTPFVLMYFDSYSCSDFVKTRSSRLRREKRWYKLAIKILLCKDSARLPFEDVHHKAEYFYTPIFLKNRTYNPAGDIVFGGAFYPGFRPVSLANDFLKSFGITKNKYSFYSNSREEILKRSDIKASDYIGNQEFAKICENAKAILVIGNGDKTKTMPSKFYDALSYRIPLICLNFGPLQQEIEQLSICYSAYDPTCLEKIDEVKQNDLDKFDVFKLMPERDPKVLSQTFDRLFLKTSE